jgi:hypothetical protein
MDAIDYHRLKSEATRKRVRLFSSPLYIWKTICVIVKKNNMWYAVDEYLAVFGMEAIYGSYGYNSLDHLKPRYIHGY